MFEDKKAIVQGAIGGLLGAGVVAVLIRWRERRTMQYCAGMEAIPEVVFGQVGKNVGTPKGLLSGRSGWQVSYYDKNMLKQGRGVAASPDLEESFFEFMPLKAGDTIVKFQKCQNVQQKFRITDKGLQESPAPVPVVIQESKPVPKKWRKWNVSLMTGDTIDLSANVPTSISGPGVGWVFVEHALTPGMQSAFKKIFTYRLTKSGIHDDVFSNMFLTARGPGTVVLPFARYNKDKNEVTDYVQVIFTVKPKISSAPRPGPSFSRFGWRR